VNPTQAVLDRLFQQILEGWDIPTPQGVLRLKQEDAVREVDAFPYPLVKNLAHAAYWQDIWLKMLEGTPRPPSMEVWKNDWREPDPSEYATPRRQFIEGVKRARWFAGEGFSTHKCASDEKAVDLLLRIAIHDCYHLGQMNTLKRGLAKLRKK